MVYVLTFYKRLWDAHTLIKHSYIIAYFCVSTYEAEMLAHIRTAGYTHDSHLIYRHS